MITEFFISWSALILSFVIDRFPNADLNILSNIITARGVILGYIWGNNWWFPVWEFLSVFGIVLSIEGFLFSIKIVRFLARNISLGLFKG